MIAQSLLECGTGKTGVLLGLRIVRSYDGLINIIFDKASSGQLSLDFFFF